MGQPTSATYLLRADWQATGTFSGTDDDISAYVTHGGDRAGNDTPQVALGAGGSPQTAITTQIGLSNVTIISQPQAGSMNVSADNSSQLFSPGNATSPLFGLLKPGVLMQLGGVYPSGGTGVDAPIGVNAPLNADGSGWATPASLYNLWTGYLDNVPQHPEATNQAVSLPAMDGLSRWSNKLVTTAQLYQAITTDVALGHLADLVGWPSGARIFDTGQTTLLWWWLTNQDAFQALIAIWASEGPGAAIIIDQSGNLVFQNRNHRQLAARSASSQVTFMVSGTEPLHSPPFAYDPGLKNVVNAASMSVNQRAVQALQAIWTGPTPLSIAAGTPFAATVTPQSGDPFTGAVAPVSGTDFTVTSGSVTSVTLSQTSGGSTVLTITAGAGGATVTGLQLRAQPVTVTSTTTLANTLDESASIRQYGLQTYDLPVTAEVDLNDAQDFLNAVVGWYSQPRPLATLSVIANGDPARMAYALTAEISDMATIYEPQTGLNADDMYINQIGHLITSAGFVDTLSLGCEDAAGFAEYAVWDGTSSKWDTAIWGL